MLQNHSKGMNFPPDNQKKTQKKSQTCHIFLIWIGIECRNGNEAAYGERHAT